MAGFVLVNGRPIIVTSPLKNDNLLRALCREPVDHTPVWIMRQAGRYLPEYREVRAKAGDFMALCTNPELACEVTMQPLRRFDLDAAILFSDILTIPDAMGLGLYFTPGEGPRFHHPVRDAASIAKLSVPDIDSKLRYVTDAVSLIRRELDGKIPLIGFSGSPWTLATYMVEGGSSKNFSIVKGLAYSDPKAMHQLLDLLAQSVIVYLNAQIEAGAQVAMIFDTWGGTLSPQQYQDFSVNYMAKIADGLIRNRDGRKVPVVMFSKGVGPKLATLANAGCDAVGVDWTVSLSDARRWTKDRVALQGNLDPCILHADEAVIRQAVRDTLADFGDGPGHVFNLGHGIHPNVEPERLGAVINEVHRASGGNAFMNNPG